MYILSILREAAASAVILIPVFLILWRTRYHDRKRTLLYGVFTLYLCSVYQLVGLPNILLIPYLTFEPNLNLIPLYGILEDLKNAVLNVLLFVPLGFFLPVLWKKYGKFRSTLCFGLAATVLIELLQILTYRATDINDILTNTLGTVIGYFAARIILGRHADRRPSGRWGQEVYFLCILAVFVMFFVQPFLSTLFYSIL